MTSPPSTPALLEPSDFSEKVSGDGKPLSEPRSCEWKLDSATVRLVVVQRAYTDIDRYERRTEELTLEGRRAWRGVETNGNTSTGIYVVELSPGYSLDVRAERTPAGYSIDKVAREAATAALKRLDRRS